MIIADAAIATLEPHQAYYSDMLAFINFTYRSHISSHTLRTSNTFVMINNSSLCLSLHTRCYCSLPSTHYTLYYCSLFTFYYYHPYKLYCIL